MFDRSSSYMGFSWSLVAIPDALGWTTSLDTRQGAYVTIAAGAHVVDLSASNVLLASCRRHADGQREVPHDMMDAAAAEQLAARQPLEKLWRPEVVAKVADFGFSVRMNENQTHASNRFQGTPAYVAPEVLAHGRMSKAADVWAFGCVLLELCHGDGISRVWALAGRRAAAPPPPANCPPALAALLARCLARDAAARPAFAEVVHVLVEAVLELHATNPVELEAVPPPLLTPLLLTPSVQP
ncbi:Mitogen-activated protein kinase kinase kinase 12 [Tetrabaena socialis]|uniref:Mitogen-activated protein kinase kinase kinase 12 n=1 Tax=Tetrabaena socialis TaxID=47790 RepID=A0A2J8A115_9CHLO|nr:Mitogen-activated protein kinase kinase kinase 12 [Tetrabaena socialis]|eukprot:PNH06221.1 Mitogen-activated protein kinase kinase kinase 12 [Tetrabaena socialis]